MKLLVLALDGGDPDIIQLMDMPFAQQLLKERTMVPIEEDLWSRGWAEITSGMHALDNGAFYEKPKLDGTCNFAQSYKLAHYKEVPGSELLWEKINRMGYSVGFVNLPTTMPAPKVDGFFVSGAGSGFSPASRVPEQACYPTDIAYELLKKNYIWEQRFRVSGISDFDFFINRCIDAVKQRAEIFIELCKKHKVDMGFVMHKEFTVIVNLFMYIIYPLLKNKKKSWNSGQLRIGEFFRVLDDFLRITVTELAPQHIMIVSDHAARPYINSLNLNYFLVEEGFATGKINKKKVNSSIKDSFIYRLRKKMSPHFFDTKAEGWTTQVNINHQQSSAFANRYIPGIYLNDERFLNKVASKEEKQQLIKKIIDRFNDTPEAKANNMLARPYREEYQNRFATQWLPDIWIDLPDYIYPEQKGAFVQKNPFWRSFEDLQYASQDVLTGLKGRNALCSVETNLVKDLDLGKKYDQTIAYDLIIKHFE